MRILFTADLHIFLNKKKVPKDWAYNRYKNLFKEYIRLIHEENIELFILGGDIFDKTPTLEELSLLAEFIKEIPITTIIYDGNHEATKRGETFLSHLKFLSYINDKVQVIDDITTVYGLDICPYCKLKTLTKEHRKSNILLTHVRGSIPPHVLPEIDLNVLKPWKVVLAGDLHSYSNSQENILYPGSPVSITFHRNEIETGVIVLDTNTLEHKFIKLDLPQLIRKKVSSKSLIEKTEVNHTIYEIEGNIDQLSTVSIDEELIDKKIIQKEYKSALKLKDLSLEQEMEVYISNVLKLGKDAIDRLIQRHKEIGINDNI